MNPPGWQRKPDFFSCGWKNGWRRKRKAVFRDLGGGNRKIPDDLPLGKQDLEAIRTLGKISVTRTKDPGTDDPVLSGTDR